MEAYFGWLVLLGFVFVYDVTVTIMRRKGLTTWQTLSWMYWTFTRDRPWFHLVTLAVLVLLAAHLVFGLWAPDWAGWP